jgi:hypothetical protein
MSRAGDLVGGLEVAVSPTLLNLNFRLNLSGNGLMIKTKIKIKNQKN